MTCDCPAIIANMNYEQAQVTYWNAAINVDTANRNAAQSAYYTYLEESYACGCSSMAALTNDSQQPIEPYPVDGSLLEQFAKERAELKEKHIQQMLESTK